MEHVSTHLHSMATTATTRSSSRYLLAQQADTV
jgi:hypothetical protein